MVVLELRRSYLGYSASRRLFQPQIRNETRYTATVTAEIARATEASLPELGPLPKTMGIGPTRMKPPAKVEPPAPRNTPTMTTRNPAKMTSTPSEARFVEFIDRPAPPRTGRGLSSRS